MVYAYDNWVLLPTRDIYDTLMMAMAVNAAKDMYDKSEKRLDDFYNKYGEFISPFSKDMERYGLMMGNVRDKINWMYENGIDPLRSSEGRAMVAQLSRSIDPAEFNMMRSNAKTGYAYLDAIQKLRSQGKYSEALELFDIMQSGGLGTDGEGNNIYDFQGFSTLGKGGLNTFSRSPIEAISLRDLTQDSYKGRTARLLSQADFDDPRLAGKYKYDPNYEWSGYLYSDLLKGAPGASLSLIGDPRAAFFRDQAEQKVAATGRPYTQADVEAQFLRDIADANTWALIDPTRQANQFALDDYRTRNDIRAHASNAATDYKYDLLGKYDLNMNGKLDPDEIKIAQTAITKSGRGNKDEYQNIFREAERNIDNNLPTEYVRSEAHYLKIQPKLGGIKYVVNKDTEYYEIPASEIGKTIYQHASVYNPENPELIRYTRFTNNSGSYYFRPSGNIKAKKDRYGRVRYFISGTLQHSASEEDIMDAAGSPKIYEMEVTERDYNYGKKQEKL